MLLQKRTYITSLLLALLALCTVTSCVRDDLADTRLSAQNEELYYLGIQLSFDPNMSPTNRAFGDFGGGTEDEHDMSTAYKNFAILFQDNKLIGIYDFAGSNKDNVKENEYPEAKYTNVIRIPTKVKVEEWSTDCSCLVVLNGSAKIYNQLKEYEEGANISEILGEVWEEFDPKNIGFADLNHTYFTMTNSVFYDDNNKLHAAEKFDPTKYIKKTYAEAASDPIIVYVERMVAKLTYSEKHEKGYLYPLEKENASTVEQVWLYNGYNDEEKDANGLDAGNIKVQDITKYCRIQVTGWGVNALESESYIFKNIPSDYYFWGWNAPNYYRSYWCEDLNYGGSYPWQYRYAVDKKGRFGYYSDKDKPSPLTNFSYVDFFNLSVESEYYRKVYVPENTYGDDVLKVDYDNRTNLLAGTHLIVCADLLVDEGVKDLEIGGEISPIGSYVGINLYRDRIGVYYKKQIDCLAELVRQFNHSLNSESTMKFYYYDWTGATTSDNSDGIMFAAKTAGNYQLYYDDIPLTPTEVQKLLSSSDITLSTAYIKDGDGKLLPWTDDWISHFTIKKKNADGSYDALEVYDGDYDYWEEELKKENNTRYGYKEGNAGYQAPKHPVTSLNTTNIIKSLLFEWVGAVDHFNEGKMYYALPILHNGAQYPIEADMTTLGNYGVVRNHWYIFTLEDILRIGTPVDKPEDPIVPNRVKTNDQLNFKVKIINWHEIETTVPIL